VIMISITFGGFLLGYGVVANAYYGQSPGYGYFTGAGYDLSGWEVLNVSCSTSGEYGPYRYNNGHTTCNAVPRDLNSAGELIAFIEYRLANGVPNGQYGFGGGSYGDTRARTGAASIVHTMLGTPYAQRSRPPTPSQMQAWRDLVNDYASAGRVNWSVNRGFNVNSLYQGTDNSPNPNDVTFYDQYRDGLMIVFTAFDGTLYAIRRECGNPMGGTSLPQLQNFDMSGTSSVNDPTVLPGQSITFSHNLTNIGPTATNPTTINWNTQSSTSPAGPWNNVSGGNAGTFNAGQTKPNIGNQTVTVPAGALPGSQICRRIVWNPDTQGGGSGASAPACATVQYDFNLTPNIVISINGIDGPVTGNIAEPGDTITFTYTVGNSGLTQSQNVNCTYRRATYTGYSTTPPVAAFVPPGANCPPPRTFPGTPAPPTPTATEGAIVAGFNTSICRSFTISPVSHTGNPPDRTANACVHVARKPYTRAYGGDIVAGGGVAASGGSCATNNGAAIIGWNRRAAGSWAGSGVQFAGVAMSLIFDNATSLGNGAGAAAPPRGLSFRNMSANVNAGNFGGNFGSAPCILDYYASRPASPDPLPASLGAGLATGDYAASGDVSLAGGRVAAGTKVNIYVDGNLYLSDNIIYDGNSSWNSGTIPMLRVIVLGNIFIDNDVSQLDGLFVAQPTGATRGIIYTCVYGSAFAPPTLSGTLGTDCDNKLTVNGAFAARQVQLLRTIGTLRESVATEPGSDPSIAEVFNFNPAFWIVQPTSGSGAGEYDAITSLPPVL
jgi:hypothetical protein